MADTLKRLAGPTNIASGTSTLFTGTADHTYTIKMMRIVNPTAAAITVKLGIGGVTDGQLILPATSIDPGGWGESDDFVILSGAETLQANASATGLTFTMFGLDQG